MHKVGAVLLEKLINADAGDYRGSRVPCGSGHEAKFVDYRSKEVISVLGSLQVQRAYYYSESCGRGSIPKDVDLDIVGTGFSPGVRRMMGQVGAKESFEEGRRDLEELAGVVVTAKDIERVAEELGKQIEKDFNRKNIPENVVPLLSATQRLYIGIDGTGVPVVRRETAGRQGKAEDGIARTREAKLGVIFTQTTVDQEGKPVRDERSTSYVGAIESSEEFGIRILSAAQKRGLSSAQEVVVLGDGAAWIWNLANELFPGATRIVDYYHATEYLAELAKSIYGSNKIIANLWLDMQRATLLKGDVDVVIDAMKRLQAPNESAKEELRKTINYFETNQCRMCYSTYRERGLFIGSGVVEAGCKTVIGQRLKQSGMHWTISGANAIISLRCCQLSGQWETYWENRVAA